MASRGDVPADPVNSELPVATGLPLDGLAGLVRDLLEATAATAAATDASLKDMKLSIHLLADQLSTVLDRQDAIVTRRARAAMPRCDA